MSYLLDTNIPRSIVSPDIARKEYPPIKKLPAAQKRPGSRISQRWQISNVYCLHLNNYLPPLAAAITASETLAGGGA